MKFSLCGQYWNKYDSSVNIEDSFLFTHENMQKNVLKDTNSCIFNIIR